MPPIYDYECSECKATSTVIVSVSESDKLPESDMTCEQPDGSLLEHKWVKKILGVRPFNRGPGWGYGSKGNW